jgi:phosphate uptake regulator
MQPRKIQRVGARSYAVTLPKQWVQAASLKEHDVLFATEGHGGELILTPVEARTTPLNITVRLADIEALPQFIVLCFVRNVQTLRLEGKPDYATVTAVQQTLRHLEGYELTAHDEHGLEISFVFTDVNVTIPATVQRMAYLLKMAIAALEQGDHANLDEFEMGVDRLYHLSKRILNACLADQRLRAENGIKSGPDLFFYRTITKRLEMMGDYLYQLRDKRPNTQERQFLATLLAFLDAALVRGRPLKELQELVTKLREQAARKPTEAVYGRLADLAKDVFQNRLSIVYGERYLDTPA